MAEGGQPPFVYHIENVGTLNVTTERNVTNINKSSVGSIAISSKTGQQRDKAFVNNDGSEQSESDRVYGSQHQEKQIQIKEADITWLQSGKFGLYIKKPLHKDEKVYLGVQKLMSNTRRDVAIKRLVYKEKKRKEVDLLLKLQHPNIVQIVDAFDQRGEFHWIYIVMELCSQNLQNYIDENTLKPPDFKTLFSFSKQLVAGLAYLHQNKVVHRDLKPENVLISMCKNFIKLSDFGMSKEIQKSRSVVTVTTIGAGSEGYRSPETYQTGSKISARLDIFPLGLIIYFLFTNGKHPFGSDPYDWSYNIRKNKNLDLSQIPNFKEANAPKRTQLLELLNRMLQHEPRDRPTAEEVKNDSFFEELPREREKTLDEEVATMKFSSPSISSPPCEALTNTATRRTFIPKSSETTAIQRNLDNDDGTSTKILSTEVNSNQKKDVANSQSQGSNTTAGLHSGKTENPSETDKSIEELEEEASHLMVTKEFRKAAEVLLEIYDFEESDKLEVALKIAECELYLQRGQDQESMQRVTNVISTSRKFSAEELREMADKSNHNKNYIRSLILLHTSHYVHKTHEVAPDDAVIWIGALQFNIQDNANPLIEAGGALRDIGIRYGLEYLEGLLNELRAVKNASPKVRVLTEANCIVIITFQCYLLSDLRRLLPFGKDGIEIMEKQFGADALNYEIYGLILENTAEACEECGDISLAQKYYVAALEGYKEAKDSTEDRRRENINRTTDLLNIARDKMKNPMDTKGGQ